MNEDMILFQSDRYLCKWIKIDGDELLIADENLKNKLFDNTDKYTSEEARLVDEMIYFYVPYNILKKDDSSVRNYLRKTVE